MLYIDQIVLLLQEEKGSKVSLRSASGRVAMFIYSASVLGCPTVQISVQKSEDSLGDYNCQTKVQEPQDPGSWEKEILAPLKNPSSIMK